MLTAYIHAAMRQAHFELLEDNTFYSQIPGFQGVFASAGSLETCREQLQAVLEGWIVLGLRLGHTMPAVEGHYLNALFSFR